MIGDIVTVVVDRPLGSCHPDYPDLVYPVNYGFIPGILAGDGEEQDAYILGVEEPVIRSTGRVIAVIHRLDDVEDKWVVAPEGRSFTKEQIAEAVCFQERFFRSRIEMIGDEEQGSIRKKEYGVPTNAQKTFIHEEKHPYAAQQKRRVERCRIKKHWRY